MILTDFYQVGFQIKMQVFWNVIPCRGANCSEVLKDHNALIFRIKQSKRKVL